MYNKIHVNDAIADAYYRGMKAQEDGSIEIKFVDPACISDGYHTFADLYHQRLMLTVALAKQVPGYAFKSKQHHDGSMFEGYFIVGFDTPEGWFTYHYETRYWNLFNVKELERAPAWDGHTSEHVARLLSLPVR